MVDFVVLCFSDLSKLSYLQHGCNLPGIIYVKTIRIIRYPCVVSGKRLALSWSKGGNTR